MLWFVGYLVIGVIFAVYLFFTLHKSTKPVDHPGWVILTGTLIVTITLWPIVAPAIIFGE